MRVYPVPGRLILMPELGFKPLTEPTDVSDHDMHYLKALSDGDLTREPPASIAPAPQPEPEAAPIGDEGK